MALILAFRDGFMFGSVATLPFLVIVRWSEVVSDGVSVVVCRLDSEDGVSPEALGNMSGDSPSVCALGWFVFSGDGSPLVRA